MLGESAEDSNHWCLQEEGFHIVDLACFCSQGTSAEHSRGMGR